MVFIPVLLIIFLAFGLSVIFGEILVDCYPLAVLTIISVLYISSLFNFVGCLLIGYYIILGLCLFLLGYGLLRLLKNKNILSKNKMISGVIIFSIFFIISIWINKGRVFANWDEFSHWGTLVKGEYFLNVIGSSNQSSVLFKDYPPATGLIEYFFVRPFSWFREDFAYIGMNMFYFALAMPLFKKIKSKEIGKKIMMFSIVLLMPLIFSLNFYSDLQVDWIMGILFGFSIFAYFYYQKTIFGKLTIFTSIFVLVITKEIGLFLAMVILGIIIIDNMFFQKKKETKIKAIAVPLIAICISFFSWKLHLKIIQVNQTWNGNTISISSIFDLIRGKGLAYQIQTVKNFIHAFFQVPITTNSIHISYAFFLVLFVAICLLIITRMVDKKDRLRMSVLILLIGASACAYAMVIMMLYTFVFMEFEAIRLASYERYMTTYLIGLLFFAVCYYICCFSKNKSEKPHLPKEYLYICLLIFSIVSNTGVNIFEIVKPHNDSIKASEEFRAVFSPIKNVISEIDYQNNSIYLLSQGGNGLAQWVCQYEISPPKVNLVHKDYSVAMEAGVYFPEFPDDPWTTIISPQKWSEYILENYTLIYIHQVDDYFIKNYGQYFNDEIIEKQLYRIRKEDGELSIINDSEGNYK